MAVRIMHPSDLHLGNNIVFRALRQCRPWWNRVDESITKGLTDVIRSLSPDCIVISGDFVNKANPQRFGFAASYLRDVFLAAGFDLRERLLVVPGNHDVSFLPEKQPDDLIRLRLYRHFLCRLFDESDIEARRQRYVKVDSDKKVIFVCLDSTLRSSFSPSRMRKKG
jgi:3',5'-cyclic AMP phosphodiesterase CpdA